ncbi:MAG TPA: FCD domain-containing protein [Acidimicrobiales bacterium]|nr:FCD domain-containing protein [Acidimicrobiales bacterium]
MAPGTGRPPRRSRRQGTAVTDEAINGIKEMIQSGTIKPGDRLPKEEDLAAQLGLSRSSLREAVRSLTLVGILDVVQGDGTYVTSLGPETLLEAMSFVVDFHRDDSVLEFLAVRRVLESAATAMVAMHITPAQVGELRSFLAEVPPDAPIEVFVANDLEFHRRLVSYCGNSVLASLLESISGPTHRARVWRGVTNERAHEETRREHLAILDALEHHAPDIAAARAAAHVAGVELWLRNRLGAEAGPGEGAVPRLST